MVPGEQPIVLQAKQASHCHLAMLHHPVADYEVVPDFVAGLAQIAIPEHFVPSQRNQKVAGLEFEYVLE